MTQSSRPQPDRIDNYPTSDAGPFSGDQWAELFQTLFTGDQQATQGPLIRYLNELAVTDNGTTQVQVDTGAGFINGHWLLNTAQETWTIPAGPAGGRQDRVVMVENNSNTVVTQTLAGRPLLFPNNLTDYNGTASIEPYTARLVIVRGDDVGNLPALDQGTTLYMVELYRYTIALAVMSLQTDYRTFCKYSSSLDYETIETVVTGAATANITFSGISQRYRHLHVVAQLATDTAGWVRIRCDLIFNGDTGINYNWAYGRFRGNNTRISAQGVGDASIFAAYIIGPAGPANYADAVTIDIPNYRGTTFYKSCIIHATESSDASINPIATWTTTGIWRNTGAITSVTLSPNGAATFANGCVATLYGRM